MLTVPSNQFAKICEGVDINRKMAPEELDGDRMQLHVPAVAGSQHRWPPTDDWKEDEAKVRGAASVTLMGAPSSTVRQFSIQLH